MADNEDSLGLTNRQKLTLQILTGIDSVLCFIVICLATYNCLKFVWRREIRSTFTILFYVLVFICLVSWEITAIYYSISPNYEFDVF